MNGWGAATDERPGKVGVTLEVSQSGGYAPRR
jgi:hypothetical protein